MVKPKKSRTVKETRGRPSLTGEKSQGDRSPFIGLRLPESEIDKIDELADRKGVKRSEMIRRLIEAGRTILK